MHIAVFGGAGRLGTRIVAEASSRRHAVTVVGRSTRPPDPEVDFRQGDATHRESVAKVAADHDVLISVIKPELTGTSNTVVRAAETFLDVLRAAPDTRLIVVGGAGTLHDRSGRRLIDAPDFPAVVKQFAQAHADALDLLRREPIVNWTYLSPADDLLPGVRTGRYRLGSDYLVYAPDGTSSISMEDLAVAVLDEAESPRYPRRRFTVGY